MRMFKCEVCQEVFEDYKLVKHIEIRRYKNMIDTKPVLEKGHDVCVSCVQKIFGDEDNELDNL